jgi:hypothetical protein
MASQCMLRLTLPCAQECSPSAQVKAAAAHVQTLKRFKRNQRKKKLSLTYLVFLDDTFSFPFLMWLVSGAALRSGQGDAKVIKVCSTSKTKPLRKQRSKPQVSEVFCSVSIDLCAYAIDKKDSTTAGAVSFVGSQVAKIRD